MAHKTLIVRLMIECGNGHIGFAKLFLPVLLGSAIVRPDAASWIVAYAVLTLGVAALGVFMKAAGEDALSNN